MTTYLVGQNLGRYHVLEQLGEGGMAAVYKAVDTVLKRNVAIKVILPQRRFSETFIKRFEREAMALAQLSHPNIVKVLDYGEQDGLPYLVMEYLPGGTLRQKSGQKLAWQDAIRLVVPIAKALAYAHEQHIVHRDVKPANILLTRSGEPMLSDFGIAKILESEETTDLTGSGVGIGTPDYMAPEQGTNQNVDHRADIYALGITLYELITGRKPYQADTPMAVLLKKVNDPLPRPKDFVPDLPDHVENILFRCLQTNPIHRYATADDLAHDLEQALVLTPAQMKTFEAFSTVPEKEAKPARRNVVLWLIPVGLLSIGGVAVLTFWIFGSFVLPKISAGAAKPPTQVPVTITVTAQIPVTATQPMPTDTAVPPSKTAGMVFIPGGDYLMGSPENSGDAKYDEKPQHKVSVHDFWIDQTEVTVAAYRQCVQAGVCKINDIHSPDVPADYFSNPRYDSYPAVDVDWSDATAYCTWKSARLPTEAEWEFAAGGAKDQIYPWGNALQNVFNFCDQSCTETYKDASISDGYQYRAPVGSFPQGASPFGLYDMAGNVWEWVADWYADHYYSQSSSANPRGPQTGTDRVVKGGGWDSTLKNIRVAKRFHHEPGFYSGSLGLRCAMDGTP